MGGGGGQLTVLQGQMVSDFIKIMILGEGSWMKEVDHSLSHFSRVQS